MTPFYPGEIADEKGSDMPPELLATKPKGRSGAASVERWPLLYFDEKRSGFVDDPFALSAVDRVLTRTSANVQRVGNEIRDEMARRRQRVRPADDGARSGPSLLQEQDVEAMQGVRRQARESFRSNVARHDLTN